MHKDLIKKLLLSIIIVELGVKCTVIKQQLLLWSSALCVRFQGLIQKVQ